MQATVENPSLWHLDRIPNFPSAPELEHVRASELSPRDFRREFVNRNRPVLIKGACCGWPAFERWSSLEYLRRTCGERTVEVRSQPLREYSDQDDHGKTVRFAEFLQRVQGDDARLWVHGVSIDGDAPLAALRADIGSFAFLGRVRPPRQYAGLRVFFYKASYTDWHLHITDEHLMCQIVGAKDVALLPPDEASWEALWPIFSSERNCFDVDLSKYPRFGEIQPLRVRVEPGDALYIPIYWWHTVAPVNADFGVTLASTWASPLHVNANVRFPATRYLLRHLPRKHLLTAACGVLWAGLHQLVRPSVLRRGVAR